MRRILNERPPRRPTDSVEVSQIQPELRDQPIISNPSQPISNKIPFMRTSDGFLINLRNIDVIDSEKTDDGDFSIKISGNDFLLGKSDFDRLMQKINLL